MRTDANNLVTTAHTTRLPEQKETVHMIQQLRHEAVSGSIQDLAHIRTGDMLADCLTKSSVRPDNLVKAIADGLLPNVDSNPEFRSLVKHKAYLTAWCCQSLKDPQNICYFMNIPIGKYVTAFFQDYNTYCTMYLTKSSSDDS